MKANYGYSDAEGEFYISIDTDKCIECQARPCIAACPKSLLLEEEDPYGDMVVAIDSARRKKLKYECYECKPTADHPPLPCVSACPYRAVTHSW